MQKTTAKPVPLDGVVTISTFSSEAVLAVPIQTSAPSSRPLATLIAGFGPRAVPGSNPPPRISQLFPPSRVPPAVPAVPRVPTASAPSLPKYTPGFGPTGLGGQIETGQGPSGGGSVRGLPLPTIAVRKEPTPSLVVNLPLLGKTDFVKLFVDWTKGQGLKIPGAPPGPVKMPGMVSGDGRPTIGLEATLNNPIPPLYFGARVGNKRLDVPVVAPSNPPPISNIGKLVLTAKLPLGPVQLSAGPVFNVSGRDFVKYDGLQLKAGVNLSSKKPGPELNLELLLRPSGPPKPTVSLGFPVGSQSALTIGPAFKDGRIDGFIAGLQLRW